MSDKVKTEAEAIEMAKNRLNASEEHRKQHLERRYGNDPEVNWYSPWEFELEEVSTHINGWVLTFRVNTSDESIIDPATKIITINKRTGEVKSNRF